MSGYRMHLAVCRRRCGVISFPHRPRVRRVVMTVVWCDQVALAA